MYQPKKTEQIYRREKQKMNKNSPISPNIPSFSSSLLDEIYKSIDQNEKFPNPKSLRSRVLEKQSNVNVTVRERENPNRRIKEAEIEAMRRAYLIENWIKENKLATKSKQFDNFDSFSSSSDSNSSFETPKKIKTSTKFEKSKSASDYEKGDVYFSEKYHKFQSGKNNQRGVENDENMIKSKSRALKMYNNLKKIKQPISPGGRLTNFLNSIFNNKVSKNTKNSSPSISTEYSACSNSSKINRKSSNGEKRSVSFDPMSVIINEQKYVHKSDFKKEKVLFTREYGKSDEDEDDDMASDTSSDLFELDHLDFVGNNRSYSEELPVYETTRFHTNFAIANGLIR